MAKKTALIKQLQGTTLVAKSDSKHWVVMDGGPNTGGSEAAPTPKELLMFAVGGCTAMDVIPILKKKRVPVENVEVIVSGTTREEHPQVFNELHVEYVVYGENINPADVERAIDLSTTKYCSVHAMLSKGVKMTHSYRIEPINAAAEKQPISAN
ncbi:MAG: OsmC family protein [Ignavibacteriae bacterium]|nr:OsmC family protein [Ignavibacteriota bacterium]